jgi:hypothetical protein
MDNQICPEFIVGFCPFEEFSYDNLTAKCPLIHSNEEREDYLNANSSFLLEKTTYLKLKEIVEDLDKKIEIHSKILKQEKVEESLENALKECHKAIESYKTDEFDFKKVHGLLVLHGKLIQHWKNKKDPNLEICKNCSVFKDIGKPCKHQFCQKYKKLRKIVIDLEKYVKSEVELVSTKLL